MRREKMWVEWDDDAELSRSRKSPGKSSPLTRDSKGNLSHVVLEPVDEDDDYADDGTPYRPASGSGGGSDFLDEVADEVGKMLGELLAAMAINAYERAKPRVKRLWSERGRPAMASASASVRRKLSRDRKADDDDTAQAAKAEGASTAEPSSGVAVHEEQPTITTEAARQMLVTALAARAISDQLLNALANVTIDDPDDELGPVTFDGQVDEAQMELYVQRILAANPSVVDDIVERVLSQGTRADPLMLPFAEQTAFSPTSEPS